MNAIQTDRLILRELGVDDASFLHALMNEPSWLRFIGDKGIRTVADAERYIADGPAKMYAQHGFGLWLVGLRETAVPVGICGLIKRAELEEIDLGFAFLPPYWRKGYAFEAATATIGYARETLGLRKLLAIMSPENQASGQLLEKLGFRFRELTSLPTNAPAIKLYVKML